jgi:DNA polymerase I-like protein with 3'-5' exonuclease and polymerase domains
MTGWNIELPNTQYLGIPVDAAKLQEVIREVAAQPFVAIDTETTGLVVWKDMPLYWSLAWPGRRVTLHAGLLHHFKEVFENPNINWILANAKYDMHILANVGVLLAGRVIDIQVMHALLHEDKPHNLKFIANHILGWTWAGFEDQFGKIGKKQSAEDVIRRAENENFSLLIEYAANDAWGTFASFEALRKQLELALTHSLFSKSPPYIVTLWDLFWKVEVPYTKTLWRMERHGIKVDRGRLEKAKPEAERELIRIEREIDKLAGRHINPKSTPQLREWLINERGLNPVKWTKGGKSGVREASVDVRFLEHHSNDPAVQLVMQHRDYSKLYGTYITGLHELLDPNDRIHTRYNQDVARTGRLSCVAGDTKITTSTGTVLIKDLKPGALVWTHKNRWRPVQRVFTKGLGHMYDLHLSNGEVLTCTPDHKLLTAEGWVCAKEIIDEHLKAVGEPANEHRGCSEDVPLAACANGGADSKRAENDTTQRGARTAREHAGEGEEGSGKGTLLSVEDREEKSHEGKVRDEASQLEGGVRGRSWVPDLHPRGQAPLRTQGRDGTGVRTEGAARLLGGPPHRQRSAEQQAGQPGLDNQSRAQAHTLLSVRGLPTVTVTKVNYRGSLEVHDMTVEEDASYEAYGVFSHNSSNPNLQNIPRPENDKWSLRSAFIPEPGYTMIAVDYEQLEMRLLAAAALEPKMIQIFADGKDIHTGNVEMVFGIPYEDVVNAKKIDKKVKSGELPPEAMTDYIRLCIRRRNEIKSVGFGQLEAELKPAQNGETYRQMPKAIPCCSTLRVVYRLGDDGLLNKRAYSRVVTPHALVDTAGALN